MNEAPDLKSLKTVVINVRPDEDTYSCLWPRMLRGIGENNGVGVQLASIEPRGGFMRMVEGASVGAINPADPGGTIMRCSSTCDVLAVDAPIGIDQFDERGRIVKELKSAAEASGLRTQISVSTLDPTYHEARKTLINGMFEHSFLVTEVRGWWFDPLMLNQDVRPNPALKFTKEALEIPGKPFRDYAGQDNPERWLAFRADFCLLAAGDDSSVLGLLGL